MLVSPKVSPAPIRNYANTHLYQLSCVRIPRPTDSWRPRNERAWKGTISPEASGRSFVRSSATNC